MTLPSPTGGPTLQEVGFFDHDHRRLAQWLADGLGDGWGISDPAWRSRQDVLDDLTPTPQPRRYACVGVDGWSLILNNTPLGTDVGVLPRHAARELRCRAIRAVCADDDQAGYPARILAVYGPDGTPPSLVERTIAAANDGGRWVFETNGEPYAFEDTAAYQRRRKTDRFTTPMLHEYLRALDVPIDTEPSWNQAVLVEREH
jgi:hypothetical protein